VRKRLDDEAITASRAVAPAAYLGALLFVRAHEAELEAEAERALPDPLQLF
jgi:hypothetical protein